MSDDADPARIRSVAVHRDDVVNALEATLRTDRRVVLRVTPPFSGRMRARIHSLGEGTGAPPADADAGSIHLDPRSLVDSVPEYPEVDDTAAEYPDADLETRRERHAEAVADWRETVRESIDGSVPVAIGGDDAAETDDAEPTHEVDVVALG